MLLPNFALIQSLSKMASNGVFAKEGFVSNTISPWAWDSAGRGMAYLAADAVLYMGLAFYMDRRRETQAGSRGGVPDGIEDGAGGTDGVDGAGGVALGVAAVNADDIEDEDVTTERTRLGKGVDDNIAVHHLRKVYARKTAGAMVRPAVADLVLGIPSGECFGLLGPNGAGKSTTLSMLTADVVATSGRATLGGYNVNGPHAAVEDIFRIIGYCPQVHALQDLLTGRETLELFAEIKGVPRGEVDALVDDLLTRMTLTEHADKLTKNFSGGNKRKLSLAVAFVGNPQIVFLDEPSSGMDPAARHAMWSVIRSKMPGRSIVLTTHLMEECDVLCKWRKF